jgi:hypothetical protein
MALSVDVFIRDSRGRLRILGTVNEDETLAGSESYRQIIYGSDGAIRLGLTLLPALRDTYGVYAETRKELAQLEREVRTLLENLDTIVPGASLDDSFVPAHRLRNIINAARRARRIGGGVVIWEDASRP